MEAIQRSLSINPREEANPLSALIFGWTLQIFKKGYKKILDVGDLFQPLKHDKSEFLGDRLDRKWRHQLKNSKHPSLIKAMAATFWRELTLMGVISIFNELCIRLVLPVLLGNLLHEFRVGAGSNTRSALGYGIGIIVLTAISSLSFNHFTMTAFHSGMKFRVAVCSIIYRKALRLSKIALGNTSPGKIVNLLSNDVSRFDVVTIFLHSMWTAPMMAIIVGVLLWNEIQWAGIVGIAVVFFVVPIQSYTGKLSSKFRYQTAIRTDERVRFMDEIISGVQVIKIYAWEKPFSKLITLSRVVELKIVRRNGYVRALYMTFSMFTIRAAIFCTMMTMALVGDVITAERVFVIASYFSIISWTMSQMFVRGVAEIAEALVSFKRLQQFLERDEKPIPMIENIKEEKSALKGNANEKHQKVIPNEIPSNVVVQFSNATARWEQVPSATIKEEGCYEEIPPPILDNVSIDFQNGKLIGVVGTVGAGKSSLLQAILEELPLESGQLVVRGKVSYACQEPWVFAATIRQNILFGQDIEKSRYDAVIKACALQTDFEQFPEGDKTIIGERGASLSGGQKARVSLARAVYHDADIYLLDDPLSAVDAHVGRHLFDEVIGPHGRLARHNATRILVTHQVHFLKDADWIVILKDGKVEGQGSPHELSKSGIDIAEFLEESDDDEVVEISADEMKTNKRSRSQSKSSIKSISSSKNSLGNISLEEEDKVEESKENLQNLELTSKGAVKGSVAANYLKSGGPIYFVGGIVLLFLITQIAVSLADFWVSFWTSQEELRTYYKTNNQTAQNASDTGIMEAMVLTEQPTLENDSITEVNLNGSLPNDDTVSSIPDLSKLLSTEHCMIIHGVIVAGIFIIGIIRSIGFFNASMFASQKLHDGMFKGIISAPMRFFDTNPSGRILNRFSKDIGSTDEMLPKVLLDAGQIILMMIGSLVVTISVQPLFLIPGAVLSILFMYIRRVYLKTSKNIKRLEGITRSPVFTHLSASLYGLSTIRAFGAQKELIKEFDAHQDLHTGAWYMFISTATAFGLSLDSICLVFLTCVIMYFLLITNTVTGDKVGLAITQVMSLTGLLQWGIRQSAEAANQFMSVERILEYRDLDGENQPAKSIVLTKEWPSKGRLSFKNVFYKYFEGADPVLKGITFTINPEEKIGIVGRTGAGKSSLIGAIFRLANVTGEIIIDGVDTSKITLVDLRSKVSIIPQDPVLFSGTLRRNLDPFEEYPDEDLWRALEAVELKDIAAGAQGLQLPVMAGGSNFSVGQRQLVCLARAILRKNKVLVLDEATANVDPNTDTLIQTTIRQRFEKCTVLTIAHRLHTIMDSDRVLVMDAGLAEEFDSPFLLLQRPNGIFRQMVQTTGPQESERLTNIAREKYESKSKVA